jgi:hypothetical protein
MEVVTRVALQSQDAQRIDNAIAVEGDETHRRVSFGTHDNQPLQINSFEFWYEVMM